MPCFVIFMCVVLVTGRFANESFRQLSVRQRSYIFRLPTLLCQFANVPMSPVHQRSYVSLPTSRGVVQSMDIKLPMFVETTTVG